MKFRARVRDVGSNWVKLDATIPASKVTADVEMSLALLPPDVREGDEIEFTVDAFRKDAGGDD